MAILASDNSCRETFSLSEGNGQLVIDIEASGPSNVFANESVIILIDIGKLCKAIALYKATKVLSEIKLAPTTMCSL